MIIVFFYLSYKKFGRFLNVNILFGRCIKPATKIVLLTEFVQHFSIGGDAFFACIALFNFSIDLNEKNIQLLFYHQYKSLKLPCWPKEDKVWAHHRPYTLLYPDHVSILERH